jgi:hypothetical protein
MVEHVLEEQELAVGDARQAGTEAGVVAELGFGCDGGAVGLPFVAVGWIGELEIEGGFAELVAGEGGAELDRIAIRFGGIEQEQVGLADGPGARVDFLTEGMDAGLRRELADFLSGDGDDAASAARGVCDGAGGGRVGSQLSVQRENQSDEQADDVLRREVFAGVLVDVLVEAPDELLEKGAHLVVVEAVRVFLGLRREIDAGFLVETGENQIEATDLVEDADRIVETEAVEDFTDVFRKAVGVRFQAAGDVGVIVEQGVEGDVRGIVESESGGAAEGIVTVFEALGFQLGLRFENLRFGGRQSIVEAAKNGEREDDVLIFALSHRTVEVLSDFPEEAGDTADVLDVIGHRKPLSETIQLCYR